ncbi:hypothetical protein GCM10020331_077340 [Ectobacillus funiculus]
MSLAIAPNSQSHFAQGRFALKYIFPSLYPLHTSLAYGDRINLYKTKKKKRKKVKKHKLRACITFCLLKISLTINDR